MKLPLVLVFCALLPACALFQRPPRPSYASPQEAAEVKFPIEPYDIQGNVSVSGTLFMAMQLAMEDYLPWDLKPHKGATPSELCLYKRDSYDMIAAPVSEELVFVQLWPRPGACDMDGMGPSLDGGAYYAIDVKNRRILAVHH